MSFFKCYLFTFSLVSSVRAIVALNLHNYASGRNPWGNLKPEYLEKVLLMNLRAESNCNEIFAYCMFLTRLFS